MSKTISFNLSVPLMHETVINETFKRGELIRASDEKNTKLAYMQQVENSGYQKQILDRNMVAAIEEVKSHMVDFLSNNSTDTSISTTISNGDVTFSITTSGRYNNAYANTLSRMIMKYIEDYMIMNWWADIDNNLYQVWQGQLASDIVAINRCFHKTSPDTSGDYTTATTATVTETNS